MFKGLIFILIILILGLGLFFFLRPKGEQEQEQEQQPLPKKNEKMISITTIYDNYLSAEALAKADQPNLKNDWGFSCLICDGDQNILFDTGTNGKILLDNMEELKVDPKIINSVVISHDHYDHYGGLSDFLEQNNKVKVYILSVLQQTKNIAENFGATVLEIDTSLKITENIYTTGEMGAGIKEHSLIVKTSKGLIVITGCSHPGIVNIIRRTKELFPKEGIHLVLGGFHLFQASDSELKDIINSFKELGVQKAAPCHCSGDRTRELFKQEYKENFIENGVGKVINIE